MKARQDALGKPVPDMDLLIAATAVQHNLILATLDTNHFALIEGLRWENWSEVVLMRYSLLQLTGLALVLLCIPVAIGSEEHDRESAEKIHRLDMRDRSQI